MRERVTTSGSGFCGFCGSVSQTVDIAYFSRFWACGSLVVFGTRVAHCVSETGKAAKINAQRH